MGKYLDTTTWARRDLFEFFRNYDNPYFNICAQLDVTRLLDALQKHPETSISLTYHYIALRVGNEIEPFRYRMRDGRVFVHDVIHGGTIVLLPNESFNFAYFNYYEEFGRFMAEAASAVKEAQSAGSSLTADDSDDRIHFTVLPWVAFTSFAHARHRGPLDSVPKIAFGKFIRETGRTLLPVSVEVHHALMDGLHVGRYLDRFQELLNEPESWLG